MFHADLHVHSKYSRATSRNLDLEHLALWAARKGIGVVGTGDCVHPAWLAEIRDKLVPEGNGLFRLKPEIEADIAARLPTACRAPVRFMLSTEISTIYKKGEKTRKVHHLIYVPDFDAADRLAARLGAIGNIASDGRPILGLDSRDLLEIALESGPDSYLVPAHIWTPWFSALGSQSGFDSIQECYGDLAEHIFAVETGLSSDPEMNWRVSFLDKYRLTSNSDAHSPGKLGREATRFSCAPDYFAIKRALETGDGYEGTVEFFPEEGKYHMDGHRNCGVRLDPKETLARDGLCPVCGKRVTIGVAHRVEVLADRDDAVRPDTAGAVASLVPLPEILSEIVGSGVGSKAVAHAYERTTTALGAELAILDDVPVEDIARADALLGEAVTRLREGTVIRHAGYDGEYGVIRLFADGELDRFTRGDLLFDAPVQRRGTKTAQVVGLSVEAATPPEVTPSPSEPSGRTGILAALDADQARAAEMTAGPLTVVAGPGSGKTRMLTHRIAHLVAEIGVPAASCLAITFTRKATEELRARLDALLSDAGRDVAVHSFHSLGLAILRAHGPELGLAQDFRIAGEAERAAALAEARTISGRKAAQLIKAVSVLKRTGGTDDGDVREARVLLDKLGREQNWIDFDDLVARSVELFETHPEIVAVWRERFSHIVADEFQDVDEQQYRLLRLMAGKTGNLCVIGDPDQAIYGFRGADARCFARFGSDFPAAQTAKLARNYRSSGTIVTASAQLMGRTAEGITQPMAEPIVLHAAPDEKAEAAFVAETIESLLGGHDLLTTKSGETRKGGPLSFADFAVLYRTDAQAGALREALDAAGIPFKKSTPAPLAGHEGVKALLAELAEQDASDDDLAARIATAAETARQAEDADKAALGEARSWLTALAAARTVAGNLAALREQVALSTEADFRDARADRVSLLTMHAAKGLEFPVVFIVGLEDGLTPFSWGGDDARDAAALAEERRLFYVAVTRAKDRLILSRANERHWRGAVRTLPPSPFLADIAPELVTHRAPRKRSQKPPQQYSLF
ncbi:UvrD-helicase domain-containing protein [Pelagibacterium halotolerans]|uniref:UvrD-helicase domain-containing protein n=1 Tax=Pelagibacterium halotolerans TaxID=531813 RepID=UPI00384C941A